MSTIPPFDLDGLIHKYNVAAPRYTSYPTVPFWHSAHFNETSWKENVVARYANAQQKGISLYVHLPYCESLCTYCGCNTRITKNHSVEEPYIASVLKEWTMYKSLLEEEKIVIQEIHLGGGTPTFFQPKNLEKLIQGLLEGNEKAEDASFSFEGHPANTTAEHLQALYDLGFRRLSLGIQDFDDQVQYVINRKQTLEDVQSVMNQARAIGYTSINFDLIYGLPMQKLETVEHTMKQSLLMRPDRISFYSYAHIPWMKPGQRRFTDHDLPTGKAKLELYHRGRAMILEQGYADVGMDHFALQDDALFQAAEEGTLHRNFMGYTDRYTPLMIGLGVSSISDAWTAFAQNVKNVEDYQSLVAQGEFPLFKGHLLNKEDLQIRQYILDLMCRSEMRFVEGLSFNENIKRRLPPLVEDQLIGIDGDRVIITEVGKSFMRNICMAYDERLQRAQESDKRFSQAI